MLVPAEIPFRRDGAGKVIAALTDIDGSHELAPRKN
jgi:hypothetical protein